MSERTVANVATVATVEAKVDYLLENMGSITTNKNNLVVVSGVRGELTYSHTSFGEKFLEGHIKVERKSGNVDNVPILISERLNSGNPGDFLVVGGHFRSFNAEDNDGKKHLKLALFVREVYVFNEGIEVNCVNKLFLDGYICKEPVYRETPLGREITDLFVAVNRPYGKSDYIPCIAWGRNARYVSKLPVGTHIILWGRIQSRNYTKKTQDGTELTNIAYEVSVSRVDVEL